MTNKRSNKVLLGSGLLLALTSSLCCIMPVLALIGGAESVMSAFGWAAPLRPYLLAATALVLGFSFHRAYRPQGTDDCGCQEKKSILQSKAFLWVAAASATNIQQAVIHIRGMGCADCEGIVNRVLLQRKGVRDAHTSYAKGEAVVQYDPTQVSVVELGAAIQCSLSLHLR